jgi:hypothetical protein
MKKSTKKTYRKLEKIVSNTYEQLLSQIIIKINDQYVLYNKYSITRKSNSILVLRRRDNEQFTFDVMKHAMIWITLDYNKKFVESKRMKVLDSQLISVNIDKQIHFKLKNCKDFGQSVIYTNKLQSDNIRHKRIIAEIDKYYKLANVCHNKEIKNELNGISRK